MTGAVASQVDGHRIPDWSNFFQPIGCLVLRDSIVGILFPRQSSLSRWEKEIQVLHFLDAILFCSPHTGMNGRVLIEDLRNGYRMKQPKYSPNVFGELMRNCWKKHPKERPTFSQLAEKIEKYIELLTNSDYLDMNEPCENVLAKEIDDPSPTYHLEIVKMISNRSLSEQTDVAVSRDTWNRWIFNGNTMN